ncbi:MAG: hypothetical protein KAV83_10680 [Desulfobacterales bacterium]|nr:hypothetical protein [Desulfobacterales bacterium]
MPRQARIDAPSALQHVIVRGIERRAIFRDNLDKENFVKRLGVIVLETSTACYAWALLSNHYGIETDYLRTASKKPDIVTARSVLCYLMVRKLKVNGTEVALKLNITPSALSKAVIRGQSVIAGTGVEKHLLEC